MRRLAKYKAIHQDKDLEVFLEGYSKDVDIIVDFPKLLKEFISSNLSFLSAEKDPIIGCTRNANKVSIGNVIYEVSVYIHAFWKGVQSRLEFTDTTIGPTSCSEAPAESLFSVWGRIVKGKESLTLDNCNSLVRVAMEGPKAATLPSFELSRDALNRWPSHLGKRFCTANWKKKKTIKVT